MLRKEYVRWFLKFCFIIVMTIIVLPVLYTYFYHHITGMPKAIDGNIDLSDVSYDGDKLYLDGQWEFYWNSFIISESHECNNPNLIVQVPKEWSHYKINGENLSAGGFASYKLKLTGLQYNNAVTAFIPDFGGAYRVFIDGQLAAESGVLSKNINEVFTVPKADLFPIKLSSERLHEVVIEIATTRFSGLYMTPVFGDYNKVMRENSFRNAVRFILFGIALFTFFILIAMYALSIRRKLYSFWMPIMILFILMRVMITTEFYSFWQPIFFFNLSYESTNEFMYLVTFVLKYLLIFLMEEQCGIPFNKREKIGFAIYYLLLYLIYLFVPKNIYNNYLSVYIPMLTYALDVYLFIKIYLGKQKLKKFGITIFLGVTLVSIGLAIDSYYINGKTYINMSLTMLLFFVVFLIIMSYVYTMRILDLYDDFAISSSRLELAKKQIDMQKEYYDSLSGQVNEIRKIKHDIHHFIGVMSKLADEGKFDELKMFLDEYCEKAKMDQLPVFCENTVANSIIGYYYLRAKEYGINFESRCIFHRNTAISDSDLCIILGNALENAVYACRQMDNSKIRFVSIEAKTMKGNLLIRIKNSYNGEMKIDNGRYISSKGGNSHGFGIQNIKNVIESYKGFIKIEHNEELFTLIVAINDSLSKE
ncbi:MAG: ATP-binding protein [Clostridium sp.]|nr:ATP-binding protein [Clostridium sp.]